MRKSFIDFIPANSLDLEDFQSSCKPKHTLKVIAPLSVCLIRKQ